MWKKSTIVILVTGVFWLTAFDPRSPSALPELPERVSKTFEPVVVLELFTSQGCSSCPAADALLKKVKELGDSQVFTLSYHVDYWNYIGWTDPFSQPQYSKKQALYNDKFKYRSNYTPEMVINGSRHFIGSDASRLAAEIGQQKKVRTPNAIALTELKRKSATLNFSYEVSGELTGKNIRAVLVLDEKTTKIGKGENRNRSLTNSNIVIAEKMLTLSENKGKNSITIPGIAIPGDKIKLVLLVEDSEYTITAAAGSSIEQS